MLFFWTFLVWIEEKSTKTENWNFEICFLVEFVYFALIKTLEIILKIKMTIKLAFENGSDFWKFLGIFKFLSISSMLNLDFRQILKYYNTKNYAFCHLHTLISGKLEKIGSFSRKKLKLAFRVLNNCGTVVKISSSLKVTNHNQV